MLTNFPRKAIAWAGPLGLVAALAAHPAHAAVVNKTWIGTWDATGSGNVAAGGPGMAAGQRYVVAVSYDDGSAVTSNVDILTGAFTPSGQTMSTINLNDAGNSLNIYVPMEGLDAGSPFIYTQNQGNHFPAFVPNPTLNFVDGAPISDPGNIIGLEYEGDFVAGGNNNIIELFNTTPGAATPVNMVSQVINLGQGPAATDTNGLVEAAPVIADDTTVTYSAGDLTQTTSLNAQGNDLGAGRSDGETFLDGAWSIPGTIQANGVDIAVDIANSGLTNTIDNATWNVTVTEEMTGLSDGAQALVDYANASPTAGASGTANATGYDFSFNFDDDDLTVNLIIAAFEVLTIQAFVDGTLTSFFDLLLGTGAQSALHSELEAAFGLGAHSLEILVEDLAGELATATVSFFVEDTGQPPPVPAPSTLLLLLLGLGVLARRSRA